MNDIKAGLLIGSLLAMGAVTPEGYGQTFTYSTVAGGSQGTNNGVNTAAQFSDPSGVAVDSSGHIYVADQLNNLIRRITPHGTNWIVTTLAGSVRGGRDGTNSNAEFSAPTGLAVDSASNIYVADQFNYTIRKVSPSGTNWVVSTIAGQTGVSGSQNGTNSGATFFNPTGVALDAAGNIFVADEFNNAIREVSPSGTNWVVSTVAGGTSGSLDATGTNAQFFKPFGLTVDASDRIFVADQFNNLIRLITPSGPNWVVTTIAGQLIAGASNGIGTNAQFTSPVGVALDTNGNLYVADLFNDAIRELTPSGSNWVVSTVGGGRQGSANGVGTNAEFYLPYGLTTDAEGNLFIADSGNNDIRLGLSSLAPPQVGSLTMTLTPSAAVTAGAEWQFNGGPFQTSGTTLTNLAAGRYTVVFSNVSGFTTPADQFVTITALESTIAMANYPTAIPNAGSLQVLIFPHPAVAVGAEWQVDGGSFETNGAIVAGLSIGAHSIAFNNVAGWNAPSPQVVTVTNSQTTLGVGIYTNLTSPTYTLTVNAFPAADGTVGASGTVLPAGSTATLTASANNGYEFIGWAGQEATGTNNPLLLTVNTNLTVTGYFAPAGSMNLIVITNGIGTVTPNWNGRTLRKSTSYRLLATAKSGNLFSNWTGSITTNKNPLTIKMESSMVLQANIVPNPFPPIEGIYNGLFVTTNGVIEQTAGMLSHLSVGQRGNYSGALLINGGRHGISGMFDLSGHATNPISRPTSQGGPLVAQLALDSNASPPELSGTVSGTLAGSNWVAALVADRATNVLPSAEFTLLIPPDTNNPAPGSAPGGDGYAAITNYAATPRNSAAATTRITGALADGTAFNQTVPVSQDGYVPIYASLYGGKGLLLGWINLASTNASGVSLTWIHPARQSGLYQAGFTNILLTNQILLSPWSNAPATLGLLTNLSELATFTNTNALATYPVTIIDGRITGTNVRGTINPRTGTFTVTIGTGGDATRGAGAILLNTTNGGGYFLNPQYGEAIQLGR